MAGELLMIAARVRLDWSSPSHWAAESAGCRRCHTATHGRDERGRAIHQSCQEEELAAEMAGQLTSRFVDERVLPSAGWRSPGGRR
jgi:hypothetical protein